MNICDFSIIIPVYREQKRIHSCLEMLLSLDLADQAEFIVVDGDNGSTLQNNNTQKSNFDIKERLRVTSCPKGRGKQLRAGAELAKGRYLIFLHVDTAIPKNALSRIKETLQTSDACTFDLKISTKNPLIMAIAAIATLRSRICRIPYGDQVHCFRRESYLKLGGHRTYPIMEDVDLMLRLRRSTGSLSFINGFAKNPERRWRKEGIIISTLRNWGILFLYRAGRHPDALAKLYAPHNEDR